MSIVQEPFGRIDGQAVSLFTLTNAHGLRARITNYGCTIVALETPDRDGRLADIVLGFDDVARYPGGPYFGAIIGRFANRIAGARFTLAGREYRLAANNGPNHVHGGIKGFDKRVWTPRIIPRDGREALQLAYLSPDGEEGYPGNLDCAVIYDLNDQDEFVLEYSATTDRPTHVNLTNHSYFNLVGAGRGDILGHELTLGADAYTPSDAELIPTGEIRPVDGTPFDFREPRAIGERIDQLGGGYDHNYCLRGGGGERPAFCARLREPAGGRMLEVYTTTPGVQLYTCSFADAPIIGKAGRAYGRHAAVCLETQHYPDAPNRPHFPSTELGAGQTYRQVTIWRFRHD